MDRGSWRSTQVIADATDAKAQKQSPESGSGTDAAHMYIYWSIRNWAGSPAAAEHMHNAASTR